MRESVCKCLVVGNLDVVAVSKLGWCSEEKKGRRVDWAEGKAANSR